MHKVLATSLLLAALGAPALQAQHLHFGLGGGLTMPMGDYNTADKMGFHGLGMLQLAPPAMPIQFRGEGMYSQSSHDGVGGNTKITGGMVSVVYPFGLPAAPIRPYVLGGLGYYSVKVDITGFGSGSESKIGFGGGGGVMFGLGGMHAFAEARYMSISTSGGSTAFVPITVGLMFGH